MPFLCCYRQGSWLRVEVGVAALCQRPAYTYFVIDRYGTVQSFVGAFRRSLHRQEQTSGQRDLSSANHRLSLPRFGFGLSLGRFRLFGRGGLCRRLAPLTSSAKQSGRIALGPLGRDDDRVWQSLRAALVSQDLVGLGSARALERDLLQLVLELFLRELAALQPRARLDDLFDVELEDIAPAELALGPLPLPQEHAEPPPAFLQRQPDLLANLVVIGDRFLGFARERHPDRGH